MKRILLIYHFFHPDPVISARLFSELAEYLAEQDLEVTVFTGNRMIRSNAVLPPLEQWGKVTVRRFRRPGFSQGSNLGRLINSAVLQLRWLNAFRKARRNFDVVILGTDPQFGYMMFPFFRWMNRKIRLIHWAFDLFPEAVAVNSPGWMKLLARLANPFVKFAYRFTDDMIDIGPCMRGRLQRYRHPAECTTLTPWALAEPEEIPEADPALRKELFGEAELGLLYSGTVGHAHDLHPFIELARECRRQGINAAFCFAGYGNCYAAQTAEITPEDTNIRLAGFTSEEQLAKRLAAADIHLVSLRPGWEGIVVPSKFFGSLAIGRPVLFSGPEESEISRWIREYGIGYRLDDSTPDFLRDPVPIRAMRQKAFQTYRTFFSRQVILNRWVQFILR